ncbi:50S ribosomal protein L25 [Chloroflexota bacterium]
MQELKLTASKRIVLGKKNRFLRREGLTPAHIFGHNIESQSLQCDTAQLKHIIAHAGTTRLVTLNIDGDNEPKSVFVREVQKDALGKQLFHVDLYQVKKGEKMAADIPIVMVGEAPAMKGKGCMLAHGITSLSIECVPDKVPPQIEVDISILEEIEQAIHVRDIVLDPDILVHADPDQLVVKVSEVGIKEAEAEEAEKAEVEAEAGEAPEQPSAE